MSFSWTENPREVPIDMVRARTNDIDENKVLLQDEIIEGFLSMYDNMDAVVATACEAIAAKFGQLVQESIGDLKRSYQQRYEHYTDLATRNWQLASGRIPTGLNGSRGAGGALAVGGIGVPSAGGLDSPNLFGRSQWPSGGPNSNTTSLYYNPLTGAFEDRDL